MKYFLQRDGRTYGPYSYDDLKRYQAENRIGPNDLVRKEDSQQWEPWQQVLNPAPAATPIEPAMPQIQPQYPAYGAGGYTPPAAQQQPQAPAFGQNPPGYGNPPAFGNQPPAFGGGGFGQPPAGQAPYQPQQPMEQGFGGGGFGHSQQPMGSDAPGAFGAFGAQAFGGQPQGGGYGGHPMGQPGGFGGGGAVGPMPPDMQWWLVLLIGMVTCGLFLIFWIYKQAQFVKRLDPQCDAPKFYLYALILYVAGYAMAFIGAIAAATMGSDIAMIIPMLGQLVILGGVVCLILAAFKMRTAIHNYYTMVEPMGINLMDTTGAVLTFFFSVYFFQYHFANIAARKKAMGHPSV
ncbi:MAG: GYF domain-containing protein [Bryobacteraceae bacterium]